MPKKTITITVPASSLADRVLCNLLDAGPGWHRTFSVLDGSRRVAACLASLARRRMVLRAIGPSYDWTGRKMPAWQSLTGHEIKRAALPGGRVQWTAEVDA